VYCVKFNRYSGSGTDLEQLALNPRTHHAVLAPQFSNFDAGLSSTRSARHAFEPLHINFANVGRLARPKP